MSLEGNARTLSNISFQRCAKVIQLLEVRFVTIGFWFDDGRAFVTVGGGALVTSTMDAASKHELTRSH
jgi:hypothetical protein